MAMGFHGYLKCFQKIEMYQYLKPKHEAYTVGLLLGGAASMIGTANDEFSKALCINISYLHPRNLEIEISPAVQCAALVGEGLLFKGSNIRQVTEMLLSQIGKRPINSKNTDRESYTLSAGFALGIVNLGSGSELPGMADLTIDERLIRFIEGGKTMPEIPSMKGANEQDQCSSVKEGDNVNLYNTLPGAIIALALIHLKTNNKQISERIELPRTFFALEYSRPSDVLLKVLCKNMIMWDPIEASNKWISSQIPEIIRTIYSEKEIENVEKKYQTRVSTEEIDFANIAMLYTYFLTGSLFSIGFKYAGSGNREVFNFLNKYIDDIISMRRTNSNSFKANLTQRYTNANKNDIDERTYQTCLCVTSYAISMVMAGTGDVKCFVTLRRVRKIIENEMNYGFNMAIHTAIGFLFLGSGKYTFSTSNLSVAALLIALYPKFPENTNDNRYHLQALRHFYVLAIENRLLQTIDIDSGELVSVPLNIEYKQQKNNTNTFVDSLVDTREVQTPIMLEDMHKIHRIHLTDKKYYELIIDKPESYKSLQKGSQSVFARASHLVDKTDYAQKSVSKIS
jgi:anaphase-promoting complex subunit 1